MTKDEMVNLAREVYGYDFRDNTPQTERIVAFATACFNAGLERAAEILDANWYRTQADCAAAIREEIK